jgi:hypothetical protein
MRPAYQAIARALSLLRNACMTICKFG